MRALNTSDLMKAVAIAGKIGMKAKDAMKLKEGEQMDNAAIGITYFSVAAEHAEKDVKAFLAGIAEMSIEEFDKMPFDYSLEVIEHLTDTEDLAGFLQRVGSLMKRISKKPLTDLQADTVGQ